MDGIGCGEGGGDEFLCSLGKGILSEEFLDVDGLGSDGAIGIMRCSFDGHRHERDMDSGDGGVGRL